MAYKKGKQTSKTKMMLDKELSCNQREYKKPDISWTSYHNSSNGYFEGIPWSRQELNFFVSINEDDIFILWVSDSSNIEIENISYYEGEKEFLSIEEAKNYCEENYRSWSKIYT